MKKTKLPNDWRDIPGYGGVYQISRQGEVRTWRKMGRHKGLREEPRLLNPRFFYKKGAYTQYYVQLRDDNGKVRNHTIRRLVADAYMGGIPKGMVPYSKNGDAKDCCINNIGFGTRQEVGRMFGGKFKRRTVAKVDKDGNVLEFYPSVREAARANYMGESTVRRRCKKQTKEPFAGTGFSFRYDDKGGD